MLLGGTPIEPAPPGPSGLDLMIQALRDKPDETWIVSKPDVSGDPDQEYAFTWGDLFSRLKSLDPAPIPPPPVPVEILMATVTAVNGLNVRAGPGTTHPILRVLKPGTQIRVRKGTEQNDFIMLADSPGYVHTAYIRITPAVPP
jgi:uncharacterized protein YgiM (DUF1202 family)